MRELGSTQRYQIARGLNSKIVYVNGGIEYLLKTGISNEGDFLAVTEYFNQYLKYGNYEYGFYEMCTGMYWVDIPSNERFESFDYYGGMIHLSPTQNSIDYELVEKYKQEILKGVKPTMVLIHVLNSWMFYILDGHHKFHAYRNAGVAPQAIIITNNKNVSQSSQQAISLAKKMNCSKIDYYRIIKKEKLNLAYYKHHELNLEEQFTLIEK